MKTITSMIYMTCALFALACFALLPVPKAFGVVPPPDGGYPGGNTAEGQNALFSLSTGGYNTAVGYLSLTSNSTSSFNTAIGAGALLANTAGYNTATGAAALLRNTTGGGNTATGAFALFNNTDGVANTAHGDLALFNNTTGITNTAIGSRALTNSTADDNTANGSDALFNNTTGFSNTAVGSSALRNNVQGFNNTAIGTTAGLNITGSHNVCIGADVFGLAGVNSTTWIKNVYASVATARAVYVDADNKIGTLASTRRVKDDVKPMDKISDAIHALKPVTFRYKKEIDHSRTPQFGLIAEEVAEVNPNLVTRDDSGQPQTVRYDAINALLLNEFLKEHKAFVEEQRKVQDQGATIAQLKRDSAEQQKQIDALTTALQKVSAQVELNNSAPRTALNNQ